MAALEDVSKIQNIFSDEHVMCVVSGQPNEAGVYRAWYCLFPQSKTRESLMEVDIQTGNYLNWPFRDVEPEEKE